MEKMEFSIPTMYLKFAQGNLREQSKLRDIAKAKPLR